MYEMDYLKKSRRPSFAVATVITHIITCANLPAAREQTMLLEVTAAMTEFGNADDILKQPLPVAYTRSVRQPAVFSIACLLYLIWIWQSHFLVMPIHSALAGHNAFLP